MKVKAISLGVYGLHRKKIGAIFELTEKKLRNGDVYTAEQQFSAKWMVKLDPEQPQAAPAPKAAAPEPAPSAKSAPKGKGKAKAKDKVAI